MSRRVLQPLTIGGVSPKAAGVLEYGTSLERLWFLQRGLFMPAELERIAGPALRDTWIDTIDRLHAIEAALFEGTAATLGSSADRMHREAAVLGRAAVTRALALKEGARPPSGSYRVLFAPQPVAEILNYMVVSEPITM